MSGPQVEELSGSISRELVEGGAIMAALPAHTCGLRARMADPERPGWWTCTRVHGHDGDHVAHVFTSDGPRAVARWPGPE